MVTFDPTESPDEILECAANEETRLTAFFTANADTGALGAHARQFTYQEFPQQLTWNAKDKRWQIRRCSFAIGQMYFVPPNAGERFYLRTLLTVAKGPRSFEELRTYNGTVHPTFLEACLARGLLEDDGEWRQCLEEACVMQTGTRLRHLFSTILLFCEPTLPAQLWEEFREHICDDLLHRLHQMGRNDASENDVYDYGLFLLDKLLRDANKSLENWPTMPLPQINWEAEIVNPLIFEQLDYNPADERRAADERIPRLNAEQRVAFDRISTAVRGKTGELFFLNGPGGTGKTFVYAALCHALRADGLIVLCVASSGIAALLLPGGRTAHSVFKIPIEGLDHESVCNIPANSQLADLLRRVDLIIWDEIGMQQRYAVEAVSRMLGNITLL
jgi:hypothetical protein